MMVPADEGEVESADVPGRTMRVDAAALAEGGGGCVSDDVRRARAALSDRAVATASQRFFKTGPGEYGEGDRFLGVRVPQLRALAREHRSLPLATVVEHTGYVDNWDLVDTSAEHLVGAHLDPSDITPLERLADSASVWERRVALMATFHWIKRGVFEPTLRIADRFLGDPHDLIHKAVGWMLREVGKRNPGRHEAFLGGRYRRMPRTMLRYAIERLPEARWKRYLRGDAWGPTAGLCDSAGDGR